MEKHYPEVSDCSSYHEYNDINDIECSACLEPGCAGYAGDGVQFSGLLAGQSPGNDNDACSDPVNPEIMGAIFNEKEENAVQVKPGLYHQSTIQTAIDGSLDSISIPHNTTLRIFNSLPGSGVLLEVSGPMVIQNGLHHPLSRPLAPYVIPDCISEVTSCGVKNKRPDPEAPQLDENMHLWFGDCSPRRWFEIECECDPCPPPNHYANDYGEYECPASGSVTSQVCAKSAHPSYCGVYNFPPKEPGDAYSPDPMLNRPALPAGTDIPQGTIIKHVDEAKPEADRDPEQYWINSSRTMSEGDAAHDYLPYTGGLSRWEPINVPDVGTALMVKDLPDTVDLSETVNPNTGENYEPDDRLGCCPTSVSSSTDDSNPVHCWDWVAHGSDAGFSNQFEENQGIFDSGSPNSIYKVLRPFKLDDMDGFAAVHPRDDSTTPKHFHDYDPGDGSGALLQELPVEEGWGCTEETDLAFEVKQDNEYDGTIEVFDCPCCSVDRAPPDGKDNCGRCIPCFNDADDNDVDLCNTASDVVLKTNCKGKSCEAGELEVLFDLCILKVAKCEEKPPEGISEFDPDHYIPTLGEAVFHDTVKGKKTVTQTAFVTPSIVSSDVNTQSIIFQDECWKIQSANLKLAVNLTKGLEEHDPGLTVGELDAAAGGDSTFDKVDVRLNFDHSVTLKYFDGEVETGHNHNITFSNAEVRFCPCSDEEKESLGLFDFGGNDNDSDCPCNRDKKGVKWRRHKPGNREEMEVDVKEDEDGEEDPCDQGDLAPEQCDPWGGKDYLVGDRIQFGDPAVAYECIEAVAGADVNIPPTMAPDKWMEIDGCCLDKNKDAVRKSGRLSCGSCCLKSGGEWSCWQGGWAASFNKVELAKTEVLYTVVNQNPLAGKGVKVEGVTAYNVWLARKNAILKIIQRFLNRKEQVTVEDLKTIKRDGLDGAIVAELLSEKVGSMKKLLAMGLGVSRDLCRHQADVMVKKGTLDLADGDRRVLADGGNWSYSENQPCAEECEGEEDKETQNIRTLTSGGGDFNENQKTTPLQIQMLWRSKPGCGWSHLDDRKNCCEETNKDEPECPVDFEFDDVKPPGSKDQNDHGAGDTGSGCEDESPIKVPWSLDFHHSGSGASDPVVPIKDYMDLKYPVELLSDGGDHNLRIYLDANLEVSPSRIEDDDFEDDGAFSSYDETNQVVFDGKPLGIATAKWGFAFKSESAPEEYTSDHVTTYSRTSADLTEYFSVPSYSQGIIMPDDEMGNGEDNPIVGKGEASESDKTGFAGWYGKFTGDANIGAYGRTQVTKNKPPFGYSGGMFKGGFEDRNGFQWDQFDNRPHNVDMDDNGFEASSEDEAEKQYFEAVGKRGETSYSLSGDRDGHKFYQDGSSYGNSYDIHQVEFADYRPNVAPVIYYKTKLIGFLNATECANFATLVKKDCDKPLQRLKTPSAHPNPSYPPKVGKDCPECPPKQDYGKCGRVGEAWDFDSEQPYLKGEWFAYIVDPNEDYGDDEDIEPYAGIGNFKVGDWVFYPGAARQLTSDAGDSSGGGPHVAQITDILHHFPVGDYYPHYHNSDNVTGQIKPDPCTMTESPTQGCVRTGTETLGSNYPWHQNMPVHGALKTPRAKSSVPSYTDPWLWQVSGVCGNDPLQNVARHQGEAHIILCKVWDSDEDAFTSKPKSMDVMAHHDYLVNLSRFAVAPEYSDAFKDGHSLSFSGKVNVSENSHNTACVRYNDYLKNQVRYQGCMLEIIPGSSSGKLDPENGTPWETLIGDDGAGVTKQSYYPLPDNRTTRGGANTIQAFNTAQAVEDFAETVKSQLGKTYDTTTLLPIPITLDQIKVGRNTKAKNADIRATNVTSGHEAYMRIATKTKHNYERGHKVVFDAQLGGISYEVEQIPAPAFENFEHYFTVGMTSGSCASILSDYECSAASNDCEHDPSCSTFWHDPDCTYDPCNPGNVDESVLEVKIPKVVGLTLESKITRGLNAGRKTSYLVNPIISGSVGDNDVDCTDVEGYIENASNKDYLRKYGYDLCSGNDVYSPTFLSANTTVFHHQLGHVEISHGEEHMFFDRISGLAEDTCTSDDV